ncbi:tryptophan synthase subunit alpha [Shigella flexneri]
MERDQFLLPRVEEAAKQGGFVPFVTLGDRHLESSKIIQTPIKAVLNALPHLPFPDRLADGPTIHSSLCVPLRQACTHNVLKCGTDSPKPTFPLAC